MGSHWYAYLPLPARNLPATCPLPALSPQPSRVCMNLRVQVHYYMLGFGNLTSIEREPVYAVRQGLRDTLGDALVLADGDGMRLVPAFVSNISQTDPQAKIAVIIDGPKGKAAVQLARQVLSQVALVMLDDLAYTPPEGVLSFRTNEVMWRRALPMTRDASLVDDFSGRFYFREDDVCTVLVGGVGMRSLETARPSRSRRFSKYRRDGSYY